MAWNIAWNGTSWTLDSSEVPDSITSRPVTAGGGLRRTYAGATSIHERWRAQSVDLGWTGIGADLYGTLSTLMAYTGDVTFTTSDGVVGTMDGRIPSDSVREKSYGYESFDVSFRLEGNP